MDPSNIMSLMSEIESLRMERDRAEKAVAALERRLEKLRNGCDVCEATIACHVCQNGGI